MPLNGNIRKFRYDLFLNDKQIFDSLGDNLIDLTKRKLVKIVEDVIEKKGYKNLIIDKIEIDLGKIDINNLASIPRKFESELLLYFEQRVNEPDIINIKKGEEAIIFFIINGYFPWWINDQSEFNSIFKEFDLGEPFSENFINTLFENKERYTRLSYIIDQRSKEILIAKLIGSKNRFFEELIHLSKIILQNNKIFNRGYSLLEIYKIEYFLIYKLKNSLNFNQSEIIINLLKYFSVQLGLSRFLFVELLKKEIDFTKIKLVISPLLNNVLDQKIQDAIDFDSNDYLNYKGKNKISYQPSELDIFSTEQNLSSSILNKILKFLENGIFENLFNVIDHYKKLLGFLLNEKDQKLIQHISSDSFLNSEIKLERLSTITSEFALKSIAISQSADKKTQKLINDLINIFSEKSFIRKLSLHDSKKFSTSFFRRVLLIELLKNNAQKKKAFNFINDFLYQYTKSGSIERNDLLFELYRIGEKRKFRTPSRRIFDILFSSKTSIDGFLQSEKDKKESFDDKKYFLEDKSSIEKFSKLTIDKRVNIIVDLLLKLPESRDNLQKLIFQSSFFNIVEIPQLENIFKLIEKHFKFNMFNEIEKVIKTIPVDNQKQFRFDILQATLQIIISKGFQISSIQFLEDLVVNLEKSYPHIINLSLIDSKSSLDDKGQFDLSQIPKMQKTDLVTIIVDLLLKLPESRDNLQKLIFQSSFFNIVEIPQLENIFKLIEKRFKFNMFNEIEKVIKTIPVDNQKQFRFDILQATLQIIISKGFQISSIQFLEDLVVNLEKSYPQIINLSLIDSKSSLDDKGQFDLSQIPKMQKTDLVTIIVDLLLKLPESRDNLQKLIFQSSFFNIVEIPQLENIFKLIEKRFKFNMFNEIEKVIKTIPVDNQKQFRFDILQATLQIIISKGFQISSIQFLEDLVVNLEKSYTDLFLKKKDSVKDKKKKSSTLEKIIEEVSKRSELSKINYSESQILKRFNLLLALKQDILLNLDQDTFTDPISIFESYEEIIKSSKNLLEFLTKHYQDHELILAFSEISIAEKQTKKLEKLIGKKEGIFDFENNILQLQKHFNIIVISYESLKVILRTFILKKIGALGNLNEFSGGEFLIDFFESLKKEKYLNLQQLSKYIDSKPKSKKDLIFAKLLSVFNVRSKFIISNTKVKDELYFKDLVFYFLNNNSIPTWANVENFDFNDVVLFIKVIINKEDRSYLLTLINNKSIQLRISKVIISLPEMEKIKFLELIHFTTSSFSLSSLVVLMEKFFQDFKLSTSHESNMNYLIEIIITSGLWNQTSLISFIEKIYLLISKKVKFKKTEFINYLKNKGLNISKNLIQETKKHDLTNEEIIELIKFYIETNDFPQNLKKHHKSIQKKIKAFLLKEDPITISITNEYLLKPRIFGRIFSLITFNDLLDTIERNIFRKFPIFKYVGEAIRELNQKNEFSKKEKVVLSINLLIQFKNQVTEKKLRNYFGQIFIESPDTFDSVLLLIKNKFDGLEKEKDQTQKIFFEEILSSKNDISSQLETTLNPLDILDYYLEIGSISYESKKFSKSQLFNVLEKFIKEDTLTAKRILFEWVKSDLKIKRLLDLIPTKKKFFIIENIHPKLAKYIEFFSISVNQFFGAPISKLFSLKNDKELERKIIKYWLKRNIFLDSPLEIIVLIFDELLNQENVSSKVFFEDQLNSEEEIPLEMNNFLLSFKQSYANFKNQLSEELILQEEQGGLEEDDNQDAILIKNAGLIILWPFFYRLFDKCGFIIDKKFKDDESVQKSILMMQYLVTGSTEFKEHELVLNKILCGVPKNSFVDIELEIDSVHLELCESLLSGVLKNWEKLSNSSIETLRTTFLIREGILSQNEELDFNLNVIKGPFDMLIETIPWNISIIQTTFMKNRLIVDWK